MNQKVLKGIGYFVFLILILNLLLFAMRLINVYIFWGMIIFGAIFVYRGLPFLKKKLK